MDRRENLGSTERESRPQSRTSDRSAPPQIIILGALGFGGPPRGKVGEGHPEGAVKGHPRPADQGVPVVVDSLGGISRSTGNAQDGAGKVQGREREVGRPGHGPRTQQGRDCQHGPSQYSAEAELGRDLGLDLIPWTGGGDQVGQRHSSLQHAVEEEEGALQVQVDARADQFHEGRRRGRQGLVGVWLASQNHPCVPMYYEGTT